MSSESRTPEQLVLAMDAEELRDLLFDMGFEPSLETVHAIRRLVEQLGSLEAAVVALHDRQVAKRAA